MIKNQLYPYIEKYINEYLYGFTKEQLNVGVMNGIIALEGMNIRVDKLNEKLDELDLPIWLKAGLIRKIRISCSLMNFIGEKPLDVQIDDIECVLTPSYKWIFKNFSTFIEENEEHMKEAYDPTDNNSHDIFMRKINIYDSSILKKEKIFEIFQDKNKISYLLNKMFTKCLKFYYQKAYLINLKVKNVHIRFEDDRLVNFYSDIGMGVKINYLEMNLSAEGALKNNNFKCDNLNVYWEPKANILIPSQKFIDSLKETKIDETYYKYITSSLNISKNNSKGQVFIVNNFNFMGNFGIKNIESGNIDFFSKNREKNYKFFFQAATSELDISIYPEIIKNVGRVMDFMKSFYVVEPVQDFKPMRKPYNKISELVQSLKKEPFFQMKRKRLVRDFIFYLVWFQRFKNAIYEGGNSHPLNSEFSKYYNIYLLPTLDAEKKNMNDSIYLNKKDLSIIDPIKEDQVTINLNPDNINLNANFEILIKSINLHIYPEYHSKLNDCILMSMSGLESRIFIVKDKFDLILDVKNIILKTRDKIEINKSIDDKIREEINNRKINAAVTREVNTPSKMFLNNNNSMNDSYTSDFHLQSPINKEYGLDKTTINNPKLNKKLSVIQETLGQLSNKNKVVVKPKETDFVDFILNTHSNGGKVQNGNLSRVDSTTSYKPINHSAQDSTGQNMSKIINDYNKNKIKHKNTESMSKISYNKTTMNNIVNYDEKIALDLFEIYPCENKQSSVFNLKISKHMILQKSHEMLHLNIGTCRANLSDSNLRVLFEVGGYYTFFKSLIKPKLSFVSNVKQEKYLNDMRISIFSKMNAKKSTYTGDTKEYFNYIKSSLDFYHNKTYGDDNFEINYFYNLLSDKHSDFSINLGEIHLINFHRDEKTNNFTKIGKIKLPRFNSKFIYNIESIFLKISDIEIEYSDSEKLRHCLCEAFNILKDKFVTKINLIKPIINKILEQRKEMEILNKMNQLDAKKAPAIKKSNTNEGINTKNTNPDIKHLLTSNLNLNQDGKIKNPFEDVGSDTYKNSDEDVSMDFNEEALIHNNIKGYNNVVDNSKKLSSDYANIRSSFDSEFIPHTNNPKEDKVAPMKIFVENSSVNRILVYNQNTLKSDESDNKSNI